MQLIKDNPYRTIGVFGGASTREVQKQLAKVKAFSRVGKQSKMETDFDFLGGVNRDIEIITDAASRIEQAKDKVLYSLFWFFKSNHIDETALNYLAKNEVNKAIEIWSKLVGTSNNIVNSKNFSAYLNLSTILLELGLQKDEPETFLAGISFKGNLITSDYFNDFIKLVAGDNIVLNIEVLSSELSLELLQTIESNDFNLSFSDILTSFSSFPDNVINNLKKKYTERPIQNIENSIEFALVKRNDFPEKADKYGEELYINTKQDLQFLFQNLGKSHVEVKALTNHLANEILQCSIDFFNENRDNESFDPGIKALRIAKMAKSVCLPGATLNRINENIEAIEEWNETSDERMLNNKIGIPANYIIQKLELASTTLKNKGRYPKGYNDPYSDLPLNEQPHNKPVNLHEELYRTTSYLSDSLLKKNEFNINLFRLARDIVKQCKPKLDEIKLAVGESHNVYRNLSDELANLALACLIEYVNNEGNPQFGIPPNISEHVTNAMEAIGTLWMTPEFRQRYITQKQSLINLKKQVQRVKSRSSSGGCYIATMAYGDYNHPQVQKLRNFRDNVLSEYYLGRLFIRFYYATSPIFVQLFKKNQKINALIRKLLDRLIKNINSK